MRTCRAAMIAALVASGCATSAPAPSRAAAGRLPSGTWGGSHAALMVSDTGAHLEFDCASGDIDTPLVVDARGAIDATGVYVPEHGGPIVEGAAPERRPARYAGRVLDRTLTLTVTLQNPDQLIGIFELTFGAGARITKCK